MQSGAEDHHKSHNKTQETITPGAEAAHFQIVLEMLVIGLVKFVLWFDFVHLGRVHYTQYGL